MKKVLYMTLALLASAAMAEAGGGKCQVIHFKPDRVYEIKAALYKGTHIQLPERMMFPPQAGDSDLWTIEGSGHHIMVKPNSSERQGAKTNLTVVTQSNTAYHFILKRVPFDQASTCVIVNDKAQYFEQGAMEGQTMSTEGYQTPAERHQVILERQLKELQSDLQAERELSGERINGVISKYRSMIYTRYKWNGGSGFKGTNLLTDVWDDGRFTYIRVTPDHRGMLAAKAEIDGKEEMVEYKADSDHVYKISGIYPKFTLIYGENNSVTVTRRDNKSNGVY